LGKLHQAGLHTYVMIAPILPGAENLPNLLRGKVDYVLLDRLNYHYADWVYCKYGLLDQKTDAYFSRMQRDLSMSFSRLGIRC
jgi:DNA repair photolyase